MSRRQSGPRGTKGKETKTMECPVCYCDDAKCRLVCGHSFCHGCVKEWWTKACDDATCPMCRQTLYFHGMYMKVPEWEREKRELRNQSVYSRIFDDIMADLDECEDVDDFDRSLAMFSLMNLDDVMKRITDMDWDLDEETMYDVINEYMMDMRWEYGPVTYDDVMPHDKLLFVPKKPSAVPRVPVTVTGRESPERPPWEIGIYLVVA